MSTGPSPSAERSQAALKVPEGGVGATDPRVEFNKQTNKWEFEDDDGRAFEWNTATSKWEPVIDDETIKAQQSAYSVQGVDETVPAKPVLERESKKRKKKGSNNNDDDDDDAAKAKKQKSERNTAVYITKLPEDTTVEQLQACFSKAGLILEDVDGNPRIKMYYDDRGNFKGEALVVYLQEASVELAIRLLDDTELELGNGKGNMSVKKAEWDRKKSKDEDVARSSKPDARQIEQLKQKQGRRAEKLKKKLEDWSSDEDTTEAVIARNRNNKIVVLRGMFTLEELEENPTLLLDLKEDVRDECEKMGDVTNVTLYDKEPDGIITVRFRDELGARACIAKMNGRFFGGRAIAAFTYDNQKYKQSGRGVSLEGTGFDGATDDKAEQERLEKYSEWLEKGGDEGGAAKN